MRKPFLFAIIIATALIAGTAATAQSPAKPPARPTNIEPAQPRWGDKLVITYDPKVEGAKLTESDEIYIVGSVGLTDHSNIRVKEKMAKVGGLFRHELPIKEGMAYARFFFVSLSNWDSRATIEAKLYRTDGVAARTAHESEWTRKYVENFDKEIALYPDNYAAYRTKWFLAGAFERDKAKAMIEEDMKKLAAGEKTDSAEMLFALSYGYLIIGQEEKARDVLKKLLADHPHSPLTAPALQNYSYQVFALGLSGEGPEQIKRLTADYITRYPDKEFARDQTRILRLPERFSARHVRGHR